MLHHAAPIQPKHIHDRIIRSTRLGGELLLNKHPTMVIEQGNPSDGVLRRRDVLGQAVLRDLASRAEVWVVLDVGLVDVVLEGFCHVLFHVEGAHEVLEDAELLARRDGSGWAVGFFGGLGPVSLRYGCGEDGEEG